MTVGPIFALLPVPAAVRRHVAGQPVVVLDARLPEDHEPAEGG